jgi:hypothetical protein
MIHHTATHSQTWRSRLTSVAELGAAAILGAKPHRRRWIPDHLLPTDYDKAEKVMYMTAAFRQYLISQPVK